jgi:hypothetical protein
MRRNNPIPANSVCVVFNLEVCSAYFLFQKRLLDYWAA